MAYKQGVLSPKYSRINIVILIAQLTGWVICIHLLHREISLFIKIPVLIFFCLMMQGVFSFMHECFHQQGNNNKRLNWFLGFVASTIFGTAYTLYQVNHNGHHVRNRTKPEIGEYVFPDESRFKKTILYYFAILGGLWWSSLIGSLLFPFFPYSATQWLSHYKKNNTYSTAFNDFTKQKWNLMRIESIMAILIWLGVIYFLDWKLTTLLWIYAVLAFSWSSLQWIYHIRTPLHVIEGAYNLRLPRPARWLFLNFNYNLTHHRDSSISWHNLYKVSNQKETQPLWYRYILLFQPPEPMPKDPDNIKKEYF